MCLPIFAGLGAALMGTSGTIAAGTAAGASAAAVSAGAAASAAAATAGTMAVASMASTALSVVSGLNQAKASEQIAKNNAKTAEYAAQDAQRRGEEQAIEVQRKGAALKSSQRAAMAAKGLDLGYGTAADIQDQTDFFTQSDVATTRTNAANEAWSRRAQKANYQAEAQSLHNNAPLQAAGSLLSSASSVANRWYAYRGA